MAQWLVGVRSNLGSATAVWPEWVKSPLLVAKKWGNGVGSWPEKMAAFAWAQAARKSGWLAKMPAVGLQMQALVATALAALCAGMCTAAMPR